MNASARNSGMRAVMLENSNSMMNKVMKYIDPRNANTYKQKISNKNKIIYYLLDNQGIIIGVISLDKTQFTDFQNAANNDKVYSFGIKINSKYFSPLFIFEVWNDFINIKGNFIYCDLNDIKEIIEDLNKSYNIYYQLNFENIDLIFGRKVEGKKKYLKIKNGMEYKLALVSKQNNQQNRIKEYLQNYPENIQFSNIKARPNVRSPNSNTKLHSLSSNDTGKARPSVRSPNNNEQLMINTNNETMPLLPKPKKKGFLQRILGGVFRKNTA